MACKKIFCLLNYEIDKECFAVSSDMAGFPVTIGSISLLKVSVVRNTRMLQ